MSKVEEKMTLLKLYFDNRRGVGHTLALVRGIANSDAMVMGQNMDDLRHVSRLSQKIFVPAVAWEDDRFVDLIALQGRPLVVTETALIGIMSDAMKELQQARSEIHILKEMLHVAYQD